MPSIPSHGGYVDVMAGNRANRTAAANQTECTNTNLNTVGNMILDAAMSYDKEDRGLLIMSGILLGLFFGFLLVLIFVDMRAKHRTGELRDDLVGAKNMLVMVARAIPMVILAMYTKLRSLCSGKKEGSCEADDVMTAQKAQQSREIIKRLAAKTPSSLDTTTSSNTDFANTLDEIFVIGD